MSSASSPSVAAPARVAVTLEPSRLRDDLIDILRADPRVGTITLVETDDIPRSARPVEADCAPCLPEDIDAVFCADPLSGPNQCEQVRRHLVSVGEVVIVVVSESASGALAAFDLGATDYVLAPLRPKRVAESIRRICAARPPADPQSTSDDDPVVPVELGGLTTFVRRSEIRYVTAHGDYVRLHTADAAHLVRISLATLEERWRDAGFARIHRSTLVALPLITQVRTEQGRCYVQLEDVELQVSRRNTREVRRRLVRLPGSQG